MVASDGIEMRKEGLVNPRGKVPAFRVDLDQNWVEEERRRNEDGSSVEAPRNRMSQRNGRKVDVEDLNLKKRDALRDTRVGELEG